MKRKTDPKIKSEDTGSHPAKRDWPLLFVFLLLGVSLLGPLTSDTTFPFLPDHGIHSAVTAQARMAIEEGQFPLRVAPWQFEGLRFPLFQFYSSTAYLISGWTYKILFPHNPWAALKFVYVIGFMLAGYFAFLAAELTGASRPVATAAGFVYAASPYLLANVWGRGAYTEAFSQFIFAPILYALLRLALPERLHPAAAALWVGGWYVIATSHLISFVYGSLFFALLTVLLVATRLCNLRRFAWICAGYAAGVLLAAHQWWPIYRMRDLKIHVDSRFGNPAGSAWLTQLHGLLSLGSVPAAPIGDVFADHLHFNLGWLITASLAAGVWFLVAGGERGSVRWRLCLAFLVPALIAFLCAWSPVDFWKYLPKDLWVVQFTYRLLGYVGLFAFVPGAIVLDRFAAANRVIPLLAIVAALFIAGQAVPLTPRSARSTADIVRTPDAGYGAPGYLFASASSLNAAPNPMLSEQAIHGDGWLYTEKDFLVSRRSVIGYKGALVLSGVRSPGVNNCKELEVLVNGQRKQWVIDQSNFTLKLTAAEILSMTQADPVSIRFESPCAWVPHQLDPRSGDTRRIFAQMQKVKFESDDDAAILNLYTNRSVCALDGGTTTCRFNVKERSEVILPILYYPNYLKILDGERSAAYEPSPHGAYTLAQITADPGQHTVRARFEGDVEGNEVSRWTFIGILAGLIGWGVLRRRTGRAATDT